VVAGVGVVVACDGMKRVFPLRQPGCPQAVPMPGAGCANSRIVRPPGTPPSFAVVATAQEHRRRCEEIEVVQATC
jgi:hypothetical protein